MTYAMISLLNSCLISEGSISLHNAGQKYKFFVEIDANGAKNN